MHRRFGLAGVGGLLMTVGIARSADLEAGVRVRIHDYARVGAPTLARAKREAAAILARAGIRAEWAECPLGEPDAEKDATCGLPLNPGDLQMRILNRGMAERSRVTRNCLGYALLAGGCGSIASVFFHRAIELERGNLVKRAAVLGAMMAHEIGHLLLGRTDHAEAGVLRGSWGEKDLKLIAKGRMSFTDEQARLMVSKVLRRNEELAACSLPK